MELSRAEQLKLAKLTCFLLVKGVTPEGKPMHAYLGMHGGELPKLLKDAAEGKGLDLSNYAAVVVGQGEGLEPSPELRHYMKKTFAFCDDVVLAVVER